jgi:hypothetical protein
MSYTMATTMQIMNNYVESFLAEKAEGKVKAKQVLIDWKSNDNQVKLKKDLAVSIKESQPKRTKALSAYNVFMKQEYSTVKEDNEGLDPGELMKLMSTKWKEMTEKKQQKYKDAAEKLKAQMPAKKGSRKKPGQPKGASNAYIHFGLAVRPSIKEKNADWAFKAINEEVSKQWKGISEKKKEKYTKLAAADKKRYVKEMETWNDAQPKEEEKEEESKEDSGDDSGEESKEDSGDDSGDDSGEESKEDSGDDSGEDSGEDSGDDSGEESGEE